MVANQQNTYKQVYDHAVKLLSMRLHTKDELRRKLILRKYDKNFIDQALERLTELKVLNDERFAEIYLDNMIRYKTYGFYGLKMRLLQRGISEELATRLLEEQLSIEQETKIAQKFIAKKRLDKIKLMQSLKRQGFRSQVISNLSNNMV